VIVDYLFINIGIFMVYSVLPQALRKAFLFPSDARQFVLASGACGKELETNKLTGFCTGDNMGKRCRTCGVVKELDELVKSKKFRDGRDTQCKICNRLEQRNRYAKNPNCIDKFLKSVYDKAYHASHRKERNKRNRNYYQNNREEIRIAQKERYANNVEAERARSRQKYQNNPEAYKRYWRERRARQLSVEGGHYTEKEFKKLCEYYDNTCLCCGSVGVPLQADHVIPLGPPHSDEITNIQPLCGTCNKKKASKHIDYRICYK